MSEDITTGITNEVMVTVLDAERALHEAMPVGMADVLLAALTAEPETLEELESAIARFDRPTASRGFLKGLKQGVNDTPWDAGLVLIDLPARLVVGVAEPALYEPALSGFTLYCPDPPPDWSAVTEDELIWIPYRLSDDWLLIESCEGWREVAEQRRRDRAANPPFDARPVLFGKVIEFIIRQCRVARGAGMEAPISAIHEEWLMTPREDLGGRTPRQALLSKREFISQELDSRTRQWSLTGQCPQGLNPNSVAYRAAGFGTNGNVVYFELLRFLLRECWERLPANPQASPSEGALKDPGEGHTEWITQLERLRDEWLKEGSDYGFSPGWVLEQERRRLPVTASALDEMNDPDCATAGLENESEFGPMFWGLDGSVMDVEDNWVFSFHLTRESWEAERRRWDEMNLKYNQEQAQRAAETEWAGGAQIFDDRKSAREKDEDDSPL
jgi:hypothetical protein